jgi:predicted SnoaL-like aldol condensation-catalyzing enzyme
VSVSQNRELLRRVVDVFNSGDVSRVAELLADDYVDHQGLRGVALRGPDGFARVVDAARAAYAAIEVTIEDVVADESKVAARLHWRHIKDSGAEVRRQTIEILRIGDGKVLEHWGAEASRDEVPPLRKDE